MSILFIFDFQRQSIIVIRIYSPCHPNNYNQNNNFKIMYSPGMLVCQGAKNALSKKLSDIV